MNKAQDKVNDAAKENAEAAKAQAESNAAAQDEAAKSNKLSGVKENPPSAGFLCLRFSSLRARRFEKSD